MKFIIDDLLDPAIEVFLEDHLEDMRAVSPPESTHALDLEGLKRPDVTFWSAWDDNALIGCGALKELDNIHAKIKSMRVASNCRGQGNTSKLLVHMLNEAE